MKHRFRVAAIAALGLMSACRHTAPEETETETPVAVQVEEARTGPVREVIAATGLVTAAPGAELVVTAPEAARIVELPKAEGDRVRPGDLLVRFEIPSLTAGATSSRAAIEQAQARVENAKAASARVQGLFERGVAAQKKWKTPNASCAKPTRRSSRRKAPAAPPTHLRVEPSCGRSSMAWSPSAHITRATWSSLARAIPCCE